MSKTFEAKEWEQIFYRDDERRGRRNGRWAPVMVCASLAMLAGCPQQTTKAGGGVAPNVVAPTIALPVQTPVAIVAATQTQAAEAAKVARGQQLIRRAEASYRSGVNNYHAGRLEAARTDFDSAVDQILTSGLDVKSDAQLSTEFEHLVDAINTLEMSALKEGTGFSAPEEAAPLDAADQVTFPANAALTAKVQEELKTTQSDFPLVVNDYVAGFINYFSNTQAGHAHLRSSLERAGKYKAMISKDLRDEGVPQDLIYLAVAESGFQPRVVNAHSGAGGMWQFMPTQGVYGLSRNGYYDERFDPEKSSIAYAKYMKMLYNQFGDWYLAMAAYNWGAGNLQRAVMRTGYADFWELYRRNALPLETKNYVPGIIAAIIVAKNPQQYGLEDMIPDAALVSDTVTVDYAVDLRLVADVTGASLQEIEALNPSLLHSSTPRGESFDLHLPVGTQSMYEKRIKAIPAEKRTSWRFHVVREGESLDNVASSLHGRTSEIAVANGLKEDAEINAGNELVVPVTNVVAATHPTHYTTRVGDTLVTVADRFNVTVEDLRRWNNLSTTTIAAHHLLIVAEPTHLGAASHSHSRGRRASGQERVETTSRTENTKHTKASEHGGIRTKAKSAEGSAKPAAKSLPKDSAAKKTSAMKHRDASK